MTNFFSGGEENFRDLDNRISAACEGLIYISEADAPFEAFRCEHSSENVTDDLRTHSSAEGRNTLETRSAQRLFERLTTEQDWFNDDRREMAKKFEELYSLLDSSVSNLTVYRFGTVAIDIFVVGLDDNGDIVGVRTKSVET